MKQKLLYLSLVFIFVAYACDKEVTSDSIIGKWEVVSLYKDRAYDIKSDTRYILNFKDDNTVSIMLDVNVCGAEYSISCDDCIEFKSFVCTEICCDSDFATKLVQVISEATKYDINSNILTLKNLGEVKFKRVLKK